MSRTAWRTRALTALDDLADRGEPFTADDLIALVGHPDGAHTPNGRNNAVGSVFAYASRYGWIKPVGVRKANTPTRKHGMVRVWQGVIDEAHPSD